MVGALPTLNLPQKSHTTQTKSRPYRSIVKDSDAGPSSTSTAMVPWYPPGSEEHHLPARAPAAAPAIVLDNNSPIISEPVLMFDGSASPIGQNSAHDSEAMDMDTGSDTGSDSTVPYDESDLVSSSPAVTRKHVYYHSLEELVTRAAVLKSLTNWQSSTKEQTFVLTKTTDVNTVLPYLAITIDASLGFAIKVYGYALPETHDVYVRNRRSMQNCLIL